MSLLFLVCTVTWCIVWNISFIFNPWLVRSDFFESLALLFLVLLIFSCICAKYCFWIVSWFLPRSFEFFWVLRFFCTYRKIWFRIYFLVRGRGIFCGVWGGARFEWVLCIMERILYFRRNTRNFSSRIFSCYTVYIIICNLVFLLSEFIIISILIMYLYIISGTI